MSNQLEPHRTTSNPIRLVQQKREAYYFYAFLSNFYDKLVNPLFWTARMRDECLDQAELNGDDLRVIDVGSGTGFTTQGIVQRVPARNVTCVDQSDHQMAHARHKPDLADCTFRIGDAENIPAPSNHYDRYVSAGSIEYWPNPARGVREAFRVLRPGGTATLIGPLEPRDPLPKAVAGAWMLFPPEEDYRRWFREAGFENIRVKYTRPHWYTNRAEYGLAITGDKPEDVFSEPAPDASTVDTEVEYEETPMSLQDHLRTGTRVVVGSLAGGAFIPAALYGYGRRMITGKAGAEPSAQELRQEKRVAAVALGAAALIGIGAWLANRRK